MTASASPIKDMPEAVVETEALARFFRVFADPTRLAIIELLAERRRNVSDLCEQLHMPQSNVSNHLACLRWCEMVRATRIGREQIYELTENSLPHLIGQFAATIRPELAERLQTCRRLGP